jgi:large subunit ribosomal protein L13
MATQSAKASEIERKWYVVDAAGQPLGRLASKVAQISLSGNKLEDKYYHRHSGYPGGLHSESYGHLLERKPEFVVERAVKGMLPKNSLGRQMFRKLKVYADGTHPHVAQKPEAFPF